MPPVTVKICGLSTPDTLDTAIRAGAAMVGFVFFTKSPRHLTLDTARELAAQARGRTEIVALTVDADDMALDALMDGVRPEWLQLHGRETPERVAAIRARTGLRVIKAIGVSGAADIAVARDHAVVADRLLFDAKPPTGAALPGGNGVAFDWTLLAGLDLPVPFMLSGGLTPDNVHEALRLSSATSVDVSSGVETAPGRKDNAKIKAFIAAARQTG